jgi:acyl carrier protein
METNEVFDKVKGLFVEVVMAFEDEFDIEIDDEELADVSTVGQAVNLLHSKI